MKFIEAYMQIQYSNETDEQFDARVKYMRDHNDMMDRLAKQYDEPMKGLSDWDCCCPVLGRIGCDNPKCPRAKLESR